MDITVLGIDLAKRVFQLHGLNAEGKSVLIKRLSRGELAEYVAKLKPCLIGMEACGSAHHWARKFRSFGHEVKLINPAFVKPYVKSHKNDRNDAAAIVEALTRPHMRFVPIKEIKQQDLQCIHRIRERLIHDRTALVNQIRGLLSEYGIVLAEQIQTVRNRLLETIENSENQLSEPARTLFLELYEDLVYLDKRVSKCDAKLQAVFKADQRCQRISTIPGIGPITATALISSIGDPKLFENGRQLSAWLGLVPKQASSGNKQVLLGISKRGDCYLRKLLVHGARSVICRAANKEDPFHRWAISLKNRRGFNKACVAVANKNARIIWALLVKNEDYRIAA